MAIIIGGWNNWPQQVVVVILHPQHISMVHLIIINVKRIECVNHN